MWSNDIKYKYMFMFPLKNLARNELTNIYLTKAFPFHPEPFSLTRCRSRDRMAGFLQTTFSTRYSWKKMLLFLFKFCWSLFLSNYLFNWQKVSFGWGIDSVPNGRRQTITWTNCDPICWRINAAVIFGIIVISHWGRVTHVYVSIQAVIVSNNCLSLRHF